MEVADRWEKSVLKLFGSGDEWTEMQALNQKLHGISDWLAEIDLIAQSDTQNFEAMYETRGFIFQST
jgi:hypothetical protein